MAYGRENVERQNLRYRKIREAGGVECVRDVYVRNPRLASYWFVGKVAYCTGTVTPDRAVARQLNLIEEHATRLRSVELGRAFGECQIWTAPGDTEVLLSQKDPGTRLERVERFVGTCEEVNAAEVGLCLEVVTNRGVGFHVERDDDGTIPSR